MKPIPNSIAAQAGELAEWRQDFHLRKYGRPISALNRTCEGARPERTIFRRLPDEADSELDRRPGR